jgi:hypothetical protein
MMVCLERGGEPVTRYGPSLEITTRALTFALAIDRPLDLILSRFLNLHSGHLKSK